MYERRRADTETSPLERTREYLILHAADRVTLDDLAAVAGLSRFHLHRTFRRAYGLPPHAFQLRLRTALARKALDQGVRPTEIDVGFADQSHLGRHFKRHWGLTPGQYAAPLRAKHHPDRKNVLDTRRAGDLRSLEVASNLFRVAPRVAGVPRSTAAAS